MRVLVTGGSGFIGSHVVDKLLKHGFKVRIFDMTKSPWHGKDKVEFYKGSLLDLDDCRMAMNEVDIIYHLAAVADVKDVYEQPHYSEAINVRGTVNLLESARLNGKIKRFVYGSTTWVYSAAQQTEVDEDTPLIAPDHFYTTTKLTGEYYCQSYNKLYDIPYSIVRYGIPYGPRARDGAVVPIFVNKAMNGEPLTIAGDGSQFRKFVYVEDLAEGNVAVLQKAGENQIFNLDGTQKVTIKEIAETVSKFIPNVSIVHTEARPGDFAGKEVSSQKSLELLNWKPEINFEEGVGRYIDWWKLRNDERVTTKEHLSSQFQYLVG